MAKFDNDQATAWVSIQQLINDWAGELDTNEGLAIGPLLTEDCVYNVRGEDRHGRAGVERFYAMRLEEFAAAGMDPPTQRHILSNLRVAFTAADEAEIAFTLVYFVSAGATPGTNHADPMAVADVKMACRRGDDGHWRIARFTSSQPFLRAMG